MLRFGTAGIRGIFGKEIRVEDIFPLCYAIHKTIGKGVYGVAHDTRKVSVVLAQAAIGGMTWFGDDVIDFGLAPTPVLAFNTKERGLKAGICLTASHNPPEFAGIKLFDERGMESPVELESKIESEMAHPSFKKTDDTFGKVMRKEGISQYIQTLLSVLSPTVQKLEILIDCAGGAATLVTPVVLSQLGHRVITVNAHQSWKFTARSPEPTETSLKETAQLVREHGVDFGIAHDADGDRTVLIDREGKIIPDYVFSALMLFLITEKRKGDVVISINSSIVLEKLAEDRGCKVVRVRLGKTFEELFRRGGVYATEPSKIVDPSFGYWEDGLYASSFLVQHLSSERRKLDDLLAEIPVAYNLQRNIPIGKVDRVKFIQKIHNHYSKKNIKTFQDIDGLRYVFQDDSWMLFRFSGTEPKVRIYTEAFNNKTSESLLREGEAFVKEVLSS